MFIHIQIKTRHLDIYFPLEDTISKENMDMMYVFIPVQQRSSNMVTLVVPQRANTILLGHIPGIIKVRLKGRTTYHLEIQGFAKHIENVENDITNRKKQCYC